MSENSQNTTEHKEPFIKRIFEHHHEHKQENSSQGDDKDGAPSHEGRLKTYENDLKKDLKKDEEGLQKYYEEDKMLEEEGKTYGGLM
ncbi:hypothetical protein N7510_004209 [Penicillium lagena]|uniref:uncharacterized protein n=1 Tax=Penicillium lagena TaxID=94218 RepID=UPI00254155AD|nr:uncharacterized protein N7510_004209 [Penicillium lagena]KAJ5620225.1 hypothetical protein N7510_004209 [Penicillium lagena]